MDTKLKEFVERFRRDPSDPYTHTVKPTPFDNKYAGRFYIPPEPDHVEKFYTILCNAVVQGSKHSLAEKPESCGPYIGDMDLESTDINLKRLYDLETLRKLAIFNAAEIKKITAPDHYHRELGWSLWLEKSSARVEDGRCKDGFHFHYPFFICTSNTQNKYLRSKTDEYIRKEIKAGTIWGYDYKLMKTPQLDDLTGKVWMMYGSANYKNEFSERYRYSRAQKGSVIIGHAFDENGNEIPLETMFEALMQGRKKRAQYYLPRFLSIRGYKTPIKLVPGIGGPDRKKFKNEGGPRVGLRPMDKVMEDIKTITDGDIMAMLSNERAEDYSMWMDVGWTLYNIGQGCEQALQLWIDFSKRSPKYHDGECEGLWSKMTLKGKTIASLFFMAKADSPHLFKDLIRFKGNNLIEQSLSPKRINEFDVAIYIVNKFENKYLYAGGKKREWYYFENHRWREMEDEIELRNKFPEEIAEDFLRYRQQLGEKLIGADEIEAKRIKLKQDKCYDIVHELKTDTFHNKLIKMCRNKCHRPDFNKRLNMNKNLLCCENGVLDLENFTFRDGSPDDCIAFSTGINFREPTKEEEARYKDFMRKMFINKDRRKYVKDLQCCFLIGVNRYKLVPVLTGDGGNGKSVITRIWGIMLGEDDDGYFGKFPSELFVVGNASNSSAAKPEIIRAIGKRLMIVDEISKFKILDIEQIKLVSGNDLRWCRDLFDSKGRQVAPTYIFAMQLNDPPKAPANDDATWDRFRVIDAETKFVKPDQLDKYPVPESEEEQWATKRFHADLDMEEHYVSMAETMLYKSFHRLKNKLSKTGLKEPKIVYLATNNYRQANDTYMKFIGLKIEKVEDPVEAKKTYIADAQMISEYNTWYGLEYASKKKPNAEEVRKELSRKLCVIKNKEHDIWGYNVTNRKWWGYRIVIDPDAVKSGDNKEPTNFMVDINGSSPADEPVDEE